MYINEIRDGDINKRAGILVEDGKQILGCLPTPTVKYPNLERLYDLPKGHMQKGESPIEAAIRECWEETNMKFERWKLAFCGEFSLYEEPFFLFRARIEKFPPLRLFNCPSTFKKGIIKSPENCNYGLVLFNEIENKFFPELAEIIKPIINKIYGGGQNVY